MICLSTQSLEYDMLANGAHISVEVNPSHLEISFGKVNLIEERMQQIEETIRFVIETRKSKLLFTPQSDATFHFIDSIRKGVSKIQKEDGSLRNRGLFLKAALIVPQDTLKTFNMHERFFTAKDLDIQLFSTPKRRLIMACDSIPTRQCNSVLSTNSRACYRNSCWL